jgi:hypothetical protein
LREGSDALATDIDRAKSSIKDGETAAITIQANQRTVDYWINWLYGQPVISSLDDWTDNADELLERIVEVYELAYEEGDWKCANACLDAIRGALVEERSNLKDPLTLLLPLFEGNCDKTCDMLVHTLAYGPCVDSEELNKWLDKFDYTCGDSSEERAAVYKRLCRALVARCAAKTPENPKDVPDFMAPHAYHLCEPEEKFCCGRDTDSQEMDQD